MYNILVQKMPTHLIIKRSSTKRKKKEMFNVICFRVGGSYLRLLKGEIRKLRKIFCVSTLSTELKLKCSSEGFNYYKIL